MGLSDNLKSTLLSAFDEQKAVMTIVVGAGTVTGRLSDKQEDYINLMCIRSPVFSENSDMDDYSIKGFAAIALQRLGLSAYRAAADILSPELKMTTFEYATEIIHLDGKIGVREKRFMYDLAEVLDVDHELVHEMVNDGLHRGCGIL